jgi:hypothetical protein
MTPIFLFEPLTHPPYVVFPCRIRSAMSARDIATEFYNTYYGLFDSGAAGIQNLAGLYVRPTPP